MAEDHKLLAQDFEKLLSQVSPETQKKLIEASERNFSTVFEQSDDLNFSPDEIEGFRAARDAYFSSQSTTSVTNEPGSENKKKHEEKADIHHGENDYHANNPEANRLSEEATANEISNNAAPNELSEEALTSSHQNNPEPNILSTKTAPNVLASQAVPNQLGPVPRQSPGGISYLRRRGQRANRRYGPGGFAGSIAKNAAKKGAKKSALWTASWLLANPWVLAGIAAFVVIVLFIVVVAANVCQLTNGLPLREFWAPALHQLCSTETESFPPPPPGFSWDKEAVGEAADGEIGNGEPIEYRITVTFDPSKAPSDMRLDQINLVDEPHYGHQTPTVETNPYRYDGQLIYWTMSDFFNLDDGIQEKDFNLSVIPDVTDREVINYSYIESPGASGGIGSGENSAATNDTCGGKYTDIMRAISNDFDTPNSNFGDPVCSYTRPKLEELIRQTETQQHVNQGYVGFWMEMTTKCEAPNNGPNSYTRSSNPATIQGAWGLFQMGSSFTDGKPDPMKPNNQESTTRGDVTWQQQVKNTINRNNTVNNESFEYFGSAMCLCWWPEHRDKDYCRAIKNNGPRSILGPRAPARDCPTGTGLTCDTRVKCTNTSCRP